MRILRGHLPSEELLSRFPIVDEIYGPFIVALRKADVKGYDEALDKWERQLLELNVWLVFERARELVLRGLFRRVYVSALRNGHPKAEVLCFAHCRWIMNDRSTRMPISMFHCATRVASLRLEEDEVECFLANMIYKGLMKGYISHEKKTVVLSPNAAFPRLADRQNPFTS